MKRLTLLLGAAAITAVAAPVSARAQSCAWWNLTCNGLANRIVDNGWHIAGRDANGNVVYMRRRVDANGNVIFEQSRRNNYGQYLVTNNHILTRGNIYDANGERCSYRENNRGYKEECKYAKGTYVSGIRSPSSRFGAAGTDCKYQSNNRGYKEECKYDKVNNSAYKGTYKTPKVKTVKYETPKVHTKVIKYDHAAKGPKAHVVDYHAPKVHYEKPHVEKVKEVHGKGPKH